MKIALYFGSFNPVHNYHVAIANHLLEHEGFDIVQFVLSPQNPLKGELAPYEDRRIMLQKALFDYPYMEINDIESKMKKPSYTINTLNKISQENVLDEYSIIMGMDNWSNIDKWKDWETIIEYYEILVIPRLHENSMIEFFEASKRLGDYKIHPKTRIVKGMPLSDLSSTFIRNEVKEGKIVYPYMDRAAANWMLNEKLYK
jgi:nicotinate-nucleotide adenylyltransferase